MISRKPRRISVSRRLALSVLFTICAVFLSSCGIKQTGTMPPQQYIILGTVCSINLYQDGSPELYNKIYARLKELDSIFDAHSPQSEIGLLNAAAASDGEYIRVSADFINVLKTALDFADLTGGLFEPSIGPLVDLWGITSSSPHVPNQDEIQNALLQIDYKNIYLDEKSNSVRLASGIKLDLGGIAKGYAADALKKLLDQNSVRRAIIDLGGNIYAYGKKSENQRWRVGIKNPFSPEARPAFSVDVENTSVVTSGNYERYFVQDGKRYHHILDSRTGFPSESGAAGVTVISESSMIADALSTSIFLSPSDAASYAEKYDAQYLIVMADGKVRASSSLKDSLKVYGDFVVTWE